MFTNILIVSRTFLSIYSFLIICYSMVPGSWVVVGVESNVDSCFLALCPAALILLPMIRQFVSPATLTVNIFPHSSHLSSQFTYLPTVHISPHSSNFSSEFTSIRPRLLTPVLRDLIAMHAETYCNKISKKNIRKTIKIFVNIF